MDLTPDKWARVKALFDAALQQEPSERASLLVRICPEDDLRQQVEKLLSRHEEAGSFLSNPVVARQISKPSAQGFTSGQILAFRFRIARLLGKGGMGEVYEAEDLRLRRRVALKFLPYELSRDHQALERFQREARAASALDHPNICTVYEIGEHESRPFIVMQYLEGETLQHRIAQRPVDTPTVLELGIQVANALDAAHSKGIVHRDIKPGNIMLTKSGAKLLDFGLARLHAQAVPMAATLTELPTTDHKLTEKGVILGTFQYMAPEQLEGKEVDARTDIFALGGVLYEMATRRPAFAGASQASLIAAILSSEPPPIAQLQPLSPPALEHVVRTCLAKDPDERWQAAKDIALQLKWISEVSSQPGIPATVVNRRKWRERVAWSLAALFFVAALIVAAFAYLGRRPTSAQPIRFGVWTPEISGVDTPIAISPDGRRLAFTAPSDGRIWIRELNSLDAQPLLGTDGGFAPFWSPDSRFIGYFAARKLKKILVSGGPPQTICDAPVQGRGGAWNKDGIILFASDGLGEIFRVSASGGLPTPVTKVDPLRQEFAHRAPYFLPDGRHFLYLARSIDAKNEGIYIGSLDSKQTRFVLNADSQATYAPPGYLLFLREGTLLAQPFDVKSLRPSGEAVSLARNIQVFPPLREGHFAISDNGVLGYVLGATDSRLVWLDRSGREIGSVGAAANYRGLALAPEEKRVAVERLDQSQTGDIWVIEQNRGVASRITFEPSWEYSPVWSPDGKRIAYSSNRGEVTGGSSGDLFVRDASGAGREEPLFKSDAWKIPTDWSHDGRYIIFQTPTQKTATDVWVLPLLGDRKPIPYLQTEFDEKEGKFSADGHWMAYTSNESGTEEVYVRSFPDSGRRWQISTTGGSSPIWRADGKELFYLAPDAKLMEVQVRTGPRIETSAPTTLFRVSPARSGQDYAVSRDGQRFLFKFPVPNPYLITIVLNWTADLKQ